MSHDVTECDIDLIILMGALSGAVQAYHKAKTLNMPP